MKLSWKLPNITNGVIKHCKINVSFTDISTLVEGRLPSQTLLVEEIGSDDGETLQYEVSGLPGLCNVTVVLVACNTAACSPPSRPVVDSTLVGGNYLI